MIKHAKVGNWILWQINQRQWTQRHWNEFNQVASGGTPKLLREDPNKDIIKKHNDPIVYILTRGKEVLEGTAKQLSKQLLCEEYSIRRNAGKIYKGYLISKK